MDSTGGVVGVFLFLILVGVRGSKERREAKHRHAEMMQHLRCDR